MASTLTRIGADSALLGRVGAVFQAVGKSIAEDGSNPDTTAPWLYALGALGITPAAFPAVADEDLALVAASDLAELLDVAELQARRLALDALQDVDQRVEQDEQKWSQLADRWQARIDRLADYCLKTYGLGAPAASVGSIDLGFQQGWRCGEW